MELIKIDSSTMPQGGTVHNHPKITLDAQRGTVTFNPKACRSIGLKLGDRVAIVQDKAAPDNLYVIKDDTGYTLYNMSSKRTRTLGFRHKALVQHLLDAADRSRHGRHSARIAKPDDSDGVKKYGLLWL